jgi:hypothetical protein
MHVLTGRSKIIEMIRPEFAITRGQALPHGATIARGGINFSLFAQHARFAQHASAVTLVIARNSFRRGSFQGGSTHADRRKKD